MLPSFLVTDSIVRDAGVSPALRLPSAGPTLLISLGITRIIEQESLDVFVYGSSDGTDWSPKPLLRFPQKFYCGTYSMVLDLSQTPDVRYLRAEYKMNRWGRGEPKPLFGFYLFVEDMAAKAAISSRAVA